ncbi:hypothetical protein EFK50_19175 [Nocardioides marmoriginsengisoli]|uniref:Uncharacterized protein n=1 Tax=Nocardioides marmoriginsengisoli TaxID=661483 RepID=A0A3N0CB36_9ACTN|nr:hypothetical protein [Nocardioides marmoriginsengisoli]RNL60451.1 hypothetical protein EFK50_19175 [Nocardioides marmoriginsengisoli]
MRSKLTTLLTVIGAVTVLVLAANTVALATTGKAILAGKINTASKMTSITRTTPGTGLQVKTKSTANAPLAVNGKGKVVNLNADRVDGLDSSQLKTTSWVWTTAIDSATSSTNIAIPLPAGNYLLDYSAYLAGTSSGYAACYFFRNTGSGTTYFAENRVAPGSVSAGLTGSGIVRLPAGTTVALHCEATNNFSTLPSEPIQIAATRIDTLNPAATLPHTRLAGRSSK